LIRKEVPDKVDVNITAASTDSWSESDDRAVQAVKHFSTLQLVYNAVSAAGFLGKTLSELQVCDHIKPT